MRIVSLLPSATEIVYALGLGDQLEGAHVRVRLPPEAQQEPIVSSSGLPENLPLGEIDARPRCDRWRDAFVLARRGAHRPDPARADPHPGPVSRLRRAVRRRR